MGLNINDITNELDNMDLADQSVAVTTGGNFERKRIPIGKHPIRMTSYVELGMQEGGMYEGKQKPDEEQARMGFQFLGKRTVEAREDGKGAFAPTKYLTKKLSMHQKAGFYKLFKMMRGGDNSITHMGQMVGSKAWIVTVTWRTKDDNGEYITIKKSEVAKYEERLKGAKTEAEKKDFRIFDNIDWNSIGAPVVPILDEDGEDTGDTKPLKVREHIGDLQLFLWDNPKPMFWDSIHIEGTYTKKVGDKETEVSKNYIQEAIMGAKNYEGSPIQAMLEGLDDLPGTSKAKDEPKGKDIEEEIADEDIDNAGRDAAEAEKAEEEADEMDELGLGASPSTEEDDEIPF